MTFLNKTLSFLFWKQIFSQSSGSKYICTRKYSHRCHWQPWSYLHVYMLFWHLVPLEFVLYLVIPRVKLPVDDVLNHLGLTIVELTLFVVSSYKSHHPRYTTQQVKKKAEKKENIAFLDKEHVLTSKTPPVHTHVDNLNIAYHTEYWVFKLWSWPTLNIAHHTSYWVIKLRSLPTLNIAHHTIYWVIKQRSIPNMQINANFFQNTKFKVILICFPWPFYK